MIIAQSIKDNNDKIDYFNKKINSLDLGLLNIKDQKKAIENCSNEREKKIYRKVDTQVSYNIEDNNYLIKLQKSCINHIFEITNQSIKSHNELSDNINIIFDLYQLDLYITICIYKYYEKLYKENRLNLINKRDLLEKKDKKELLDDQISSNPLENNKDKYKDQKNKKDKISNIYDMNFQYLKEIKSLYSNNTYFKEYYQKFQEMLKKIEKKLNTEYKDNIKEIHTKMKFLINNLEVINEDNYIAKVKEDYEIYINYSEKDCNYSNITTKLQKFNELIQENNLNVNGIFNNKSNDSYQMKEEKFTMHDQEYTMNTLFKKNKNGSFVKSNETVLFEDKLKLIINEINNSILSHKDMDLLYNFYKKLNNLDDMFLKTNNKVNFEDKFIEYYNVIKSIDNDYQFF